MVYGRTPILQLQCADWDFLQNTQVFEPTTSSRRKMTLFNLRSRDCLPKKHMTESSDYEELSKYEIHQKTIQEMRTVVLSPTEIGGRNMN